MTHHTEAQLKVLRAAAYEAWKAAKANGATPAEVADAEQAFYRSLWTSTTKPPTFGLLDEHIATKARRLARGAR